MRAARGIENKTVASKVARNLRLAFHLLPPAAKEEAGVVIQGPRHRADPTCLHEAALRVIKKLAAISKEDFAEKFHGIHDK